MADRNLHRPREQFPQLPQVLVGGASLSQPLVSQAENCLRPALGQNPSAGPCRRSNARRKIQHKTFSATLLRRYKPLLTYSTPSTSMVMGHSIGLSWASYSSGDMEPSREGMEGVHSRDNGLAGQRCCPAALVVMSATVIEGK
jgi:hypothetical protein